MSNGPDLLDLANTLLRAMDGEASQEFQRSIEMMDADAEELKTAAMSGILRGFQASEQPVESSDDDRDPVPWQVTEVQDAYGDRIGVRIRVATSPESLDVFEGDESLLLRTPEGEVTIPISFDYSEPEIEEEVGHTSIMLRDSEWNPASGALPAGERDDEDESEE